VIRLRYAAAALLVAVLVLGAILLTRSDDSAPPLAVTSANVESSLLRSGLYVFDRQTHQAQRIAETSWPLESPSGAQPRPMFAWAGQSLVYTGEKNGRLQLSVTTTNSLETFSLDVWVWSVRGTPDGRVILRMREAGPDGREGHAYLRPETGAIEGFIPAKGGGLLSPDGRLLVVPLDAPAYGLQVADVGSGAELARLEGEYYGASWSPEGERIAVSHQLVDGQHAVSEVWQWRSGRLVRLGQGTGAIWSPDGTTLAMITQEILGTGFEATARTYIGVQPADGSAPLRRIAEGDWPDWSPGGRRLAFVRDGALYEVDLQGDAETELVRAPLPLVFEPRWSPDGRYVAFRSGGAAADIGIDACLLEKTFHLA
jgi:hypothetical protein